MDSSFLSRSNNDYLHTMMIWTILISLLSVDMSQKAAATEFPQISLSSSLTDGEGVCPGDEIKFTCVTNGSGSHAWMSDEFIGRGGIQLEFASFDSPGVVRRKPTLPVGTVARLNVKDIQENETKGILESELDVIASSEYPVSSVSCLYVDSGLRSTISVQLLDIPGEPQDVEVIQRPSNGDLCDFAVQLNPPTNSNGNDIVRYIVMHQTGSVEITGTSGSFFVPISNCTTDLRVRVAAVNRCGMQGSITGEIVPIFIVPEPTAGIEDGGQPNDGLSTAALVVVVVLVVIAFAVAAAVTIFFVWYKLVHKRSKASGESLALESLPEKESSEQHVNIGPIQADSEGPRSASGPPPPPPLPSEGPTQVPLGGPPPPPPPSFEEILKYFGNLLLSVARDNSENPEEKQKLIDQVNEYVEGL